MTSRTRFGIILPQHECGPDELLGAARLAEESGLDSVWVSDHVWGHPGGPTRPMLEGWMSLGAVAAATSRILVGTLVTRVSLRLPRVLAAMVQTAERITSGRTVIGLGIGDATNRDEQIAYGIPWPDKAGRLRLLDETIQLLREVAPGVALWIGGTSDGVLARAAKADGWNFWGPAKEFARHRARLLALTDQGALEISWAGSFPKPEGIRALREAGAGHILIAVGAGNFEERIARVAQARSRAL